MSHEGSHDATYDVTASQRFTCDTRASVIAALLRAATGGGHPNCADVAADARAAGMAVSEILDICIPAVADTLGARWRSDQLAFAEVTIGTAHLQSLVRQLDSGSRADLARGPDGPTILVLVPVGVQHTLGPMLLASQLRRRGLSVGLLLDATASDGRKFLRRTRTDAVFISGHFIANLASLRPIVEEARVTAPGVPIVIGGPDTILPEDVCRMTGADHATRNMEVALSLCGLNEHTHHPKTAEMMS
ncbi:cobalamin-dependent protein [Loktanella sp. DJP18]|uniref:cobalamin-dependent protein n=1 Tax=Loktanella sp. DJP18 TaxID=3409788 RepID=UPI003BB5A03A